RGADYRRRVVLRRGITGRPPRVLEPPAGSDPLPRAPVHPLAGLAGETVPRRTPGEAGAGGGGARAPVHPDAAAGRATRLGAEGRVGTPVRPVVPRRGAAPRVSGAGRLRPRGRQVGAPAGGGVAMSPPQFVGIQPRFPGFLGRFLGEPVAAERVAAVRIATALALLLDLLVGILPHFTTYYSADALGGRDLYGWRFCPGHFYWSLLRV